MEIQLVRPTLKHRDEALRFREEFYRNGEPVINGSEMLDRMESYEEWLRCVDRNSDPATVSPDWVVTDTFFALDNEDRIVGIIDFRHELKGFLTDFGHCGYSVRPCERKKGYATKMLAKIITVAKAAGLPSLSLSVERTNTPSVKTIIRNGGKYERSFEWEGETADVYRILLATDGIPAGRKGEKE